MTLNGRNAPLAEINKNIRVGSDEAHKSRDFPCFLTYDVTEQMPRAHGKPLYYFIHNDM